MNRTYFWGDKRSADCHFLLDYDSFNSIIRSQMIRPDFVLL